MSPFIYQPLGSDITCNGKKIVSEVLLQRSSLALAEEFNSFPNGDITFSGRF